MTLTALPKAIHNDPISSISMLSCAMRFDLYCCQIGKVNVVLAVLDEANDIEVNSSGVVADHAVPRAMRRMISWGQNA
jgi:hypothetical protein